MGFELRLGIEIGNLGSEFGMGKWEIGNRIEDWELRLGIGIGLEFRSGYGVEWGFKLILVYLRLMDI